MTDVDARVEATRTALKNALAIPAYRGADHLDALPLADAYARAEGRRQALAARRLEEALTKELRMLE